MVRLRRYTWIPVCIAPFGLANFGCGGDVTPECSDCAGPSGAGAGPACTSNEGVIEGTVYRYALPGEEASSLAPGALVSLVPNDDPETPPLYAMADEMARYHVLLAAGEWLVGGEHENCSTLDNARLVTIVPCEQRDLDFALQYCTKTR
jgi:hypothetical protein